MFNGGGLSVRKVENRLADAGGYGAGSGDWIGKGSCEEGKVTLRAVSGLLCGLLARAWRSATGRRLSSGH